VDSLIKPPAPITAIAQFNFQQRSRAENATPRALPGASETVWDSRLVIWMREMEAGEESNESAIQLV
jgi:hypothetical protein